MAKSIEVNLETKKDEVDVEGEEESRALEVEGETGKVEGRGSTEWETRRAGAMVARLLADVHIPNGG